MAHGKQKKVGIVDQAVRSHEEDFFQISKYTEGLSQFILQCETPMTIAIQGDWGSGKTSFMNLIDNILHAGEGKEAVETIWFNTWAFSQFNMGERWRPSGSTPWPFLSSTWGICCRSTCWLR